MKDQQRELDLFQVEELEERLEFTTWGSTGPDCEGGAECPIDGDGTNGDGNGGNGNDDNGPEDCGGVECPISGGG